MMDPSQDKHAQRQRIQYELSIADADIRKKHRDKEIIEMELKRLKRERDLIMINIADREKSIKKIDNDTMIIENDIKSLKKKLNTII